MPPATYSHLVSTAYQHVQNQPLSSTSNGKRSLQAIVRTIWMDFMADDCIDLAAQMSFYFVTALFPFAICLAAIIGFLPFTGLWHQIVMWTTNYLPFAVRHVVLTAVLSLTYGRAGFLSIGLIGAAWSASSGFVSLMESLSVAYGVNETRTFWHKRLIAFLTLSAVSVFFLISYALMTGGHWLGSLLDSMFMLGPWFGMVWVASRWIVTLALLLIAVSLIDSVLPNVRRRWRWINRGGLLVVGFSIVSNIGFSYYIRHFGSTYRTYGALGGFILIALWIYLTSVILLLGAETNSVLEHIQRIRG
jgi:membrane protein